MHGPLGQSLEWEAQQAQGSGLRWGVGGSGLAGDPTPAPGVLELLIPPGA